MKTTRQLLLIGLLRWTARTLWAGLMALLPLLLTIVLLGWLVVTTDQLISEAIKWFLPNGPEGEEPYYIPGMGIAALLLILLLVGVLMRTTMMRRVIDWEDRLLRRVPFIGTLYSSVRDFAQYFRDDDQQHLGQTCIVRLPGTSVQLLGFVTQQQVTHFDGMVAAEDAAMVYLPMSYQLGGYLVIVPRDHVHTIDLPFDHALSYIFMAGMKNLENDGAQTSTTDQRPDKSANRQNDPVGT
jgi:uncharacterized membrane protein